MRAGTVVAAASASSSATPSACRLRTASIIVSALPASRPSGAAHHAVLGPTRGAAERGSSPSPIAAAATASVTSAKRPRAACQATRTRVAREVVAVDDQLHRRRPARASAAHAMPGSRGARGRIALKRCVTVRTPRSNARCASAAVASVCPADDGDAARDQLVDQLERARQLGRERHLAHRAGVEQPAQQRRVRVAAALRRVGAEPLAARGTGPRGARRARAGRRRSAGIARSAASELGLRRGDERRLERGRAGRQHRLAGARVAVAVGVHEVDAGEAVDLQVDEARGGDAAAAAAAEPDARRRRRRRPRRRRGRAGRRPAPPRRRASSRRPGARRSRRAGREALRAPRRRRGRRSSDDERDLEGVARGGDGRAGALDVAARAPGEQMRTARSRSLGFGHAHRAHEVAVGAPEQDEQCRSRRR